MTASWHNIRPEYDNNKLVISKDGGETWETITFPAGIFDYGDINELIHKRIGKTGISVLFRSDNLQSFPSNWQMGFRLILQNLEFQCFAWI